MRNAYSGICYRCKLKVNPYEGHFEHINRDERLKYKITSKWRLQHADCAIKYRGTKIGKEIIK